MHHRRLCRVADVVCFIKKKYDSYIYLAQCGASDAIMNVTIHINFVKYYGIYSIPALPYLTGPSMSGLAHLSWQILALEIIPISRAIIIILLLRCRRRALGACAVYRAGAGSFLIGR